MAITTVLFTYDGSADSSMSSNPFLARSIATTRREVDVFPDVCAGTRGHASSGGEGQLSLGADTSAAKCRRSAQGVRANHQHGPIGVVDDSARDAA